VTVGGGTASRPWFQVMGARAHATERLTASLRTGLLRQTKPIWGRAKGRTSALRTRSCDEYDIGAGSAKQSQFGADSARSGPARGWCGRWDRWYKQTQFADSDRDGRPELGAAGAGTREAVAGTNGAKQSQFAPRGRKTIPKAFSLEAATRHRGQMRQTKPIRSGIGFQGSGVSGLIPDHCSPGPSCETKPIRPRPGPSRKAGIRARAGCTARSVPGRSQGNCPAGFPFCLPPVGSYNTRIGPGTRGRPRVDQGLVSLRAV
jgi:hypothetical protein